MKTTEAIDTIRLMQQVIESQKHELHKTRVLLYRSYMQHGAVLNKDSLYFPDSIGFEYGDSATLNVIDYVNINMKSPTERINEMIKELGI